MTATTVVGSNGLVLSLPWWLFAGALLLFGVTVAHNLRGGRRTVACALLLIAAADYATASSLAICSGVSTIAAASQFCRKCSGLCDMGIVTTQGCCTSQASAI